MLQLLQKEEVNRCWIMVQLREMHKKGEHYKNIICKKCVDEMYPVIKN